MPSASHTVVSCVRPRSRTSSSGRNRIAAEHSCRVGSPTKTGAGDRQLLQSGGRVHDVAHRRVVGAGDRADQHLAGVDPDPHLDRVRRVLRTELAERRLHRQPGPHGPIGVVLVRDRSAEQRDDRIAEHLVDDTAVRLDVADQLLEDGVDQALHLLGISVLGQRREPDEIGEQDRDDAPFLVADEPAARALRGATRRAEVRPIRHRLRTRETLHQAAERSGRGRGAPAVPSGVRRTIVRKSHANLGVTVHKNGVMTSSLSTPPPPSGLTAAAGAIDARKTYGDRRSCRARTRWRIAQLRTGSLHGDHGPFGIGQVDAAALLGRPRLADRGRRVHRRHLPGEPQRQAAHRAATQGRSGSCSRPTT